MNRKMIAFFMCGALVSMGILPACQNNANSARTGDSVPSTLASAAPTDKLVIYCADEATLLAEYMEEYRRRRPDVDVRVENFKVYRPRLVHEDVKIVEYSGLDPNLPYEIEPSVVKDLNSDIVEAYTSQVVAELMAGEGPDVLFLNTAFFKDIQKLATEGNLLDLNPYFEADPGFDEKAYFAPVFNLGLLGGKRLFVPEVFRIPAALGGVEILEAAGMDPAGVTGLLPLLEEVAAALPELSRNPDFTGVFKNAAKDRDAMDDFLAVAAASAVDMDTGTALPDADFLRAFFAAFKPFYRFVMRQPVPAGEWAAEVGLGLFRFYSDIQDAEKPMRSMTTFWEKMNKFTIRLNGVELDNYSFILEKELALEERPAPLVIPLASPGGELLAIADRALAVPAGAKNPQNAYEFIKVMLDTPQEFSPQFEDYAGYEHVNKELNILKINDNRYVLGERVSSAEDLTASRVTGAVLVNPALTEILMTCMAPFLNGEQSYDSCEARLRERLEIYLSE